MTTFILALALTALNADAATSGAVKKWKVSNDAAKMSEVRFKLPYSAGTHEGSSREIKASLVASVDGKVTDASLSIQVASLKTGSEKQDCHMQEALGLDYAVSGFPESHVCSSNKLPAAGVDAIKYADIQFRLKKVEAGQATGTWTIHGVSRDRTFPVTVVADGAFLHVTGQVTIPLAEHDITVKNFLFISVAEDAVAEWDLWFEAQ